MTEGVQAAGARAWTPGSAAEVAGLLSGVGYLADEHACSVLRLAGQLGKPVLVDGPAGAGKTTLATSASRHARRPPGHPPSWWLPLRRGPGQDRSVPTL